MRLALANRQLGGRRWSTDASRTVGSGRSVARSDASPDAPPDAPLDASARGRGGPRGGEPRGGRAEGGAPRGAPAAAKGRRSKRRVEGKCAGGAPLLKRQPLRRPGASASGTPGKRGEPSPKPRDPRQRPWGSTRARERQGGQTSADGGRWFDGQRTKEQRGAEHSRTRKSGRRHGPCGPGVLPLFAVYQTHRTHPTELGALPVTGAEKERARGRGSVARRLPGRALLASE